MSNFKKSTNIYFLIFLIAAIVAAGYLILSNKQTVQNTSNGTTTENNTEIAERLTEEEPGIYSGTVKLSGLYFEYDPDLEIDGYKGPCFTVDSEDLHKLPNSDSMFWQVCFSNDTDARRILQISDDTFDTLNCPEGHAVGGEATIMIEGYERTDMNGFNWTKLSQVFSSDQPSCVHIPQ